MKHCLAISLTLVGLCAAATPAHAGGKVLEYVIDHGTVGVIASATGKARLVVQANGNCRAIPYSVIADSVLAITGSFDLSKRLSMPIDYTNVTLSCSEAGVKVRVEQPEKSGLGF